MSSCVLYTYKHININYIFITRVPFIKYILLSMIIFIYMCVFTLVKLQDGIEKIRKRLELNKIENNRKYKKIKKVPTFI